MKKINNFFKQILIITFLISLLTLPYFIFAEEPAAGSIKSPLSALESIQPVSGYAVANEYSISNVVGKILTAFFSLIGIIFLILMIYGGYTWMTARGEEDKVRNAQSILQRAVIGFIITIASYAITYFIYGYVIAGSGTLNL